MKKILALVLTLAYVAATLTSCGSSAETNSDQNNSTENNQSDVSDIWVLTYEQEVYPDGDSTKSSYTCDYQYDESGKLVGELYNDNSSSAKDSDFQYDNNGNVISKTRTYTDYLTGNESKTYYTYSYDSNGNCLLEVATYSATNETKFEYDSKGNVVREEYVYTDGYGSTEIIDVYVLTYENNLCVRSEITSYYSDEYTSDEIYYSIKEYSYDKNGNRIKEIYYQETEDISNAESALLVNGRYYEHYSTTYYSWEKLSDVAVEATDTTENNYEHEYLNTTITEEDPYNGFPAPVELKMVATNDKTSIKDSTDCRFDIKSLHMITDNDGYNYIVLNYSITSLVDYKIDLGSFAKNDYAPPKLIQNNSSLDRCYHLSDECEVAYSEIISDDHIPTELRPGETREETCIYEVYDTESDIYLMITPLSYVNGTEYDVSVVRQFSFN